MPQYGFHSIPRVAPSTHWKASINRMGHPAVLSDCIGIHMKFSETYCSV
uniref:Uncharacterized protein n=1 Tax=Anguilla anguilla TaxID=7936 RepID=A0A0E9U3G7_ANGAN